MTDLEIIEKAKKGLKEFLIGKPSISQVAIPVQKNINIMVEMEKPIESSHYIVFFERDYREFDKWDFKRIEK